MDDRRYITPPEALDSILEETKEMGFGMASDPLVGAFLQVLATSKPRGFFLEIGTGTGAGTAWILSGMSADSTLITVDTDPEAQAIAVQFLGKDDRLELVTVDASEYLASLPGQSFDLVFADAMPGKYEGLDQSLALVKPGGFWIADDLLPQPNWPPGHAARIPDLLEKLAENSEFAMLPLLWGSGVVVAVRKH